MQCILLVKAVWDIEGPLDRSHGFSFHTMHMHLIAYHFNERGAVNFSFFSIIIFTMANMERVSAKLWCNGKWNSKVKPRDYHRAMTGNKQMPTYILQ